MGFRSLFLRVLLKPWSSRRHFFLHSAFASRTTDQRKKDTSKIDQRKNHQLAETNLLCLLCVWLCEQECVHSEKKCSAPKFQGTWRHWKLWNKLSRVFTGHLLNMGMRKLSSTDMTVICAYLSATYWILLWPFKRYIFFLSFCVKFVLLIINLTEKSLWKVSGIWISRQKGAGSRD